MLPALRRDPIAVFTNAARRFGDIAYLKLGPLHGVLITRSEDVRHVLQDNARHEPRSGEPTAPKAPPHERSEPRSSLRHPPREQHQ